MDTVSITGSSQLMQNARTQQAMSATLMKKAAEQQEQMADMLAQNAKKATPPPKDSRYNFSTYA